MSAVIVELLFVGLFGLTIVGFIVAINSRGPVKMSFSYVLATALLIGSVYELVSYVGEKKLSLQMKQAQAMEDARRSGESSESVAAYGEFLKGLAEKGKSTAQGITRLDLTDESVELEVYFSKASWASSRANGILKELKNRPATGLTASKSTLEKALKKTLSASRYLNLYFKSEDEYQEEERERAFRSNIREAVSLFGQVDGLVAQNK